MDLEAVFLAALERCSPERIARERIEPAIHGEEPVDIVAMGKCAAGLLDGAVSRYRCERALALVPEGYPHPRAEAEVVEGSHPRITAKSFAAGARAEAFVDESRRHVVFLVSGGSSACVERPLAPWFSESDVADANDVLLRSGLSIEQMNTARKHLSAIKGGRLGALARSSSTWIYSDVSKGNEPHVGSGPTVPDSTTNEDAARVLESLGGALAGRLRDPAVPETPKTIPFARWSVIAGNETLVSAAAAVSGFPIAAGELNDDVEMVARMLHRQMAGTPAFVAGGEPTVAVRGEGRGGRCCELALRFARLCIREPVGEVHALFAASDGLDGNSECAGFAVSIDGGSRLDEDAFQAALARSDSYALATTVGRPLLIPPTGNNLRDLFIVARKSHALPG